MLENLERLRAKTELENAALPAKLSPYDQRLAGHLTAKNPLLLFLGAAPPEEVEFEFFEVEEGDEFVECVLHGG